MPLDGNGVYAAPASSWNPAIDGTDIDASDWIALLADLATALSTAMYKDGQSTPTANIPMAGFKLTGLGAGSAAGNSVRYEQITTGGLVGLAAATVAAHATTMNPWVAREIVASGGAVTFTDIADAPYVGAVTSIYQNAAHVWTDGAVFNVQGNATYTAAIGDWVDLVARSAVDAFDLFVRKESGAPVSMSSITASLGGNVAISDAAYTDGPSIAQGAVGGWFVSGTVTVVDTVGAPALLIKLWDGTNVIASANPVLSGANASGAFTLSGVRASPAGNLRISVQSSLTTTSFLFNGSGNSKDCTITAVRIG